MYRLTQRGPRDHAVATAPFFWLSRLHFLSDLKNILSFRIVSGFNVNFAKNNNDSFIEFFFRNIRTENYMNNFCVLICVRFSYNSKTCKIFEMGRKIKKWEPKNHAPVHAVVPRPLMDNFARPALG